MPRSMWKGAISFGMVAIPVRLYRATDDRGVSFHLLCPRDRARVRNKRWCPVEDREIAWSDVVRGFEVGRDEYVEVTDADLDRVPLPTTQTIEIVEFCDAGEIADLFLQAAYYLEPEAVGVRPYYLLKRALEKTGRVAVGKIAFRDREHLVRIACQGPGLMLHTLHWPDEVRSQSELGLPEDKVEVHDRELQMAVMLVENLSQPFDPSQFTDEYRAAVEALVQEKLGNGHVDRRPEERPQVLDLMEALKASVEAAKGRRAAAGEADLAGRGEPARGTRRRASRGAEGERATPARRRKAG